jgi:hypothetical protein
MAKSNVMGRNADANQTDNGFGTTTDLGTADTSSKQREGMFKGSRNGRASVNQVHEKGDTDNGNPGESMLHTASVDSPTVTVQSQLAARAGGDSMGKRRRSAAPVTRGNTTTPELSRP